MGSMQRKQRGLVIGAVFVALIAMIVAVWLGSGRKVNELDDDVARSAVVAQSTEKPSAPPRRIESEPTPVAEPTSSAKVEEPAVETTESESAIVLASVTGRIFSGDSDAKPLAGARVRVWRGDRMAVGSPLADVRTEADGAYTLPKMPASVLTVLVTAEGHELQSRRVNFFDRFSRDPRVLQALNNGETRQEDFFLEPGGSTVSGVVLQEADSVTIASARVLLFSRWDLKLETLSNGDGTFSFEGLPERGGYSLAVAAGGFQAKWVDDLPAKEEPVVVPLAPGGTHVTGDVKLIGTDEVVADAVVAISRGSERDIWRAIDVVSDARGKYVSPSVGKGDFRLSARAGTRQTAENPPPRVQINEGASSEVGLDVFLTNGIRISGTVLEAETDKPIPGAIILASQDNRGGDQGRGGRGGGGGNWRGGPSNDLSMPSRADEKGHFVLAEAAEPARGSGMIVARADGFIDGEAEFPVALPDGSFPPVEIRMEKGRQIDGVVYDASGSPVLNAVVRFAIAESVRQSIEARTDEAGRYVLVARPSVAGSQVVLWSEAEGKGRASEEFEWPADKQLMTKDLHLGSGMELQVAVVDETSDAPVPNVRVRVQTDESQGAPYQQARSTDEQGIALFTDVPEKEVTITVSGFDGRREERPVQMAGLESPHTEVFLSTADVRVITGIVTDEKENPLQGVVVTPTGRRGGRGGGRGGFGPGGMGPGGPQQGGMGGFETDDKGYYEVTVARNGSIRFTKEGYDEQFVEIQDQPEDEPLDVALRKLMNPRLFGRIHKADGTELAGSVNLQILSRREGRNGSRDASLWGPASVALTPKGEWELSLTDNQIENVSEVWVVAEEETMGSGISERKTIARGVEQGPEKPQDDIGPLDVKLEWRMLKGKVIREGGRTGIGDALVTLRNVNEDALLQGRRPPGSQLSPLAETTSESNGKYELGPIANTALSVKVYHPDYGLQTVEVPAPTEEDENIREFDLVLEPRATVRGNVMDANGAHLADFNLLFARKDENRDANGAGRATAKPDDYIIRALEPQRWNVFLLFNRPGEDTGMISGIWMDMDLTDGRDKRLDVQLARTAKVIVRKGESEKAAVTFLVPDNPASPRYGFLVGDWRGETEKEMQLPVGSFKLVSFEPEGDFDLKWDDVTAMPGTRVNVRSGGGEIQL